MDVWAALQEIKPKLRSVPLSTSDPAQDLLCIESRGRRIITKQKQDHTR